MLFKFEDNPSFTETINADTNPTIYLGIDPGESNGICGYDAKFYLTFMFTVAAEDMNQFLKQFEKIKTCVIESFSLYPNKAQSQIYSDMLTSRVIGRVENWAHDTHVTLIKQPAKIKPTGYAWLGKKPPSKTDPTNHEQDAHVHFMYWAVRNGHVAPESLVKKRS